MMKGAGKAVSYAVGTEAVSPNEVVMAMVAAFLLYSFFGGLVASAYTDFVQGFLIILMSFMLIPLGLREVGGFAGLHRALPPDFFDLYSSVSGMSAFTLAMLALNGFVGMTAQPHVLSMCATGATERAGRIGHTYGAMMKRVCAIGWALTGLIAAALVLQRGATLPDAEHAFGYVSRELLGPGLIGLLVACVLAANMSTCSNFMVNTASLVKDLIQYPQITGYEFTSPGKRIWVLWSVDNEAHPLNLPDETTQVYDKYGDQISLEDDVLQVKSPIYLELTP